MSQRTSSARDEAPKLGHVYICDACAERVGLRESFMMIVYKRPCEGCGTPIGYDHVLQAADVVDDHGCTRTVQIAQPTRLVANCMQMWRNRMWPVAFGIAVQDFAGAHVHEWDTGHWSSMTPDGRRNYRKERCRCGETRERWEDR